MSELHGDVTVRLCDVGDLDTICDLGRRTFKETFSDMNTPENMDRYLCEAFDPGSILTQLGDPDSSFFILDVDGTAAGYLKVNVGSAQTDIHDPESLEVERIYVARGFQRRGLGRRLMEVAVKYAVSLGKKWVWLGVWEENRNAISFYERCGFRCIGTHTFILGDDPQTDLVMSLNLQDWKPMVHRD